MNRPAHTTDRAPFDLKGSSLTLMVLSLLDTDVEAVVRQLSQRFGQAPGFFRNAPVLLDLAAVRDSGLIDLSALLPALRTLGLVPVAVRGGDEGQQEAALAAGLGILSETRGGRTSEIPEPAPCVAPTPSARIPAKVITQSVRSGQRITAEGDMVVLAPVSAGSELVAGGNIHVYAPLRGRALAGARGDAEARIFALQFAPELVAIAGEYLVNEELRPEDLGQAVQVSLQNEKLHVERF